MGRRGPSEPIKVLAAIEFASGIEPPPRAKSIPYVLVDSAGATAGLVGHGGPGPAVVVPAEAPVPSVLACEDVLDALLDGVDGLVLIDDDARPLGVVPMEAIRTELAASLADPHTLAPGDLTGRTRGLPPPVRILCLTCGVANEFRRFRQHATYECRNGHEFVPYFGTS